MDAFHVSLSDDEITVLTRTVRTRLIELQNELVHTDDRAYRESLKNDLEALEAVEHRLLGQQSRPISIRI